LNFVNLAVPHYPADSVGGHADGDACYSSACPTGSRTNPAIPPPTDNHEELNIFGTHNGNVTHVIEGEPPPEAPGFPLAAWERYWRIADPE
jgi:hypothetical protein